MTLIHLWSLKEILLSHKNWGKQYTKKANAEIGILKVQHTLNTNHMGPGGLILARNLMQLHRATM